jgi:hypothetical protein
MNTTRYFGKCRTCKKTTVRDFDTVGGNRIPVVTVNGKQEDIFNAASMGLMKCSCGGYITSWKGLKAKFSAKHECSAKCLASTGPNCECSCRGKNHGAGHLVAA